MIDGKILVEKLFTYAKAFLHLEARDEIYTRNLLLREFKLTEPTDDAGDLSFICSLDVPDVIVEELEGLKQLTEKFNVWYESNLDDINNKNVTFDEQFKASLQETYEQIRNVFAEVREGLSTEANNAKTAFDYAYRLSANNKEFDFYANANFISKFTYSKFGIGAEAVKTLLENVLTASAPIPNLE